MRVAAAKTKVVVKLVANGATVGGLTKKVSAGNVTLHAKLTAKGKARLAALTKVTLKITITATSPKAKKATLKGSLVVKA